MNSTSLNSGIYSARPLSLYNYQEEVFVKQTSKGKVKNERSIVVRSFREKIGYRIACKKVMHTYLKLHLQEPDIKIKVDIRSFLEKKYKDRIINKHFLSNILQKINRHIQVKKVNDVWEIVDIDSLIIK